MCIGSRHAYYTNIALWGATAHGCAHDISYSDYRLLDEISKLAMYNIKMMYNSNQSLLIIMEEKILIKIPFLFRNII